MTTIQVARVPLPLAIGGPLSALPPLSTTGHIRKLAKQFLRAAGRDVTVKHVNQVLLHVDRAKQHARGRRAAAAHQNASNASARSAAPILGAYAIDLQFTPDLSATTVAVMITSFNGVVAARNITYTILINGISHRGPATAASQTTAVVPKATAGGSDTNGDGAPGSSGSSGSGSGSGSGSESGKRLRFRSGVYRLLLFEDAYC